ncbi:hypothetical protein Hypma_010161 [Hypsizygus marmoreus]|uniref:Magnesium transporter MgtE intracellular domain-containing protein n=1 Tax=Hypsizygus marmoreus TaxID=39966 RepID=A0A369JK97_HYPMA|nr:hypothetical protein Hypma_010161 [Hypsizygus marmoreus]
MRQAHGLESRIWPFAETCLLIVVFSESESPLNNLSPSIQEPSLESSGITLPHTIHALHADASQADLLAESYTNETGPSSPSPSPYLDKDGGATFSQDSVQQAGYSERMRGNPHESHQSPPESTESAPYAHSLSTSSYDGLHASSLEENSDTYVPGGYLPHAHSAQNNNGASSSASKGKQRAQDSTNISDEDHLQVLAELSDEDRLQILANLSDEACLQVLANLSDEDRLQVLANLSTLSTTSVQRFEVEPPHEGQMSTMQSVFNFARNIAARSVGVGGLVSGKQITRHHYRSVTPRDASRARSTVGLSKSNSATNPLVEAPVGALRARRDATSITALPASVGSHHVSSRHNSSDFRKHQGPPVSEHVGSSGSQLASNVPLERGLVRSSAPSKSSTISQDHDVQTNAISHPSANLNLALTMQVSPGAEDHNLPVPVPDAGGLYPHDIMSGPSSNGPASPSIGTVSTDYRSRS